MHCGQDYRMRGTGVPEEASLNTDNRIAAVAQTITQIVYPPVTVPLSHGSCGQQPMSSLGQCDAKARIAEHTAYVAF